MVFAQETTGLDYAGCGNAIRKTSLTYVRKKDSFSDMRTEQTHNTAQLIGNEVKSLPLGEPFTTRRFLSLGSRAAVDQTLTRMVKAGLLSRPARGVYVRPKTNFYIGEVPPEPLKVAETIAKELGAVVQVHGAEAVRRMGLSTQVPIKPVFYTSGPARRFKLGKMEVLLKHISPRKLYLAGYPAGIALTALWYLGKKSVSPVTIAKIRSRLTAQEYERLRSAKFMMPEWMRTMFANYEKETVDDGVPASTS